MRWLDRVIVTAFLAATILLISCSEETPPDDGKGRPPAFIARWGCPGHDNGEFYNPYDVAVGPGGDIYVADTNNYRVQHFSAGGG
jgi:hypothetical protein